MGMNQTGNGSRKQIWINLGLPRNAFDNVHGKLGQYVVRHRLQFLVIIIHLIIIN
jgi:hypothetical protein